MILVKELNTEAEDTLDVANKEYATEESKFNNFELTASILREMNPRLKEIQPEDIALIFMMKHLFSIAAGISLREDMRGRYKDCLNYIHLHHGIYQEKRQQTQKVEIFEQVKADAMKRQKIRKEYPNLEDNTTFPEDGVLKDPDNVFYMTNPLSTQQDDYAKGYNSDLRTADAIRDRD